MLIKNNTGDQVALIDGHGQMTVCTPGLSLTYGDVESLGQAILSSDLDLELLTEDDIVSASVAAFKRLVSGQLTVDALQRLKSLNRLKQGHKLALTEVVV